MSEEIKTPVQESPEKETGAESATMPKDDVMDRVKNFNAELKVILGKYELALGAEARISDGKVLADPKVLDARTLPKN